jgi:hypothetical protein
MMTEGKTKPAVAATEPGTPATLAPTKVAALMPMGPGVIWEMVKISTNSPMVIQACPATTSSWMRGSEA